ncbi:MAG: basic amino acid ABC transporter substrate-binding protein [Actinobacteria bacterium]|nr:basic amino acid ABC transporter substrate-binding protein [Actinomycetota bacterium]
MRRTNIALVLVLVLALVATACATGSSGDYKLVKPDTLTICTDAPYPPFEFQADDGSWTGFDMDLMSKITDGLGLKMEVTVQPFDGIWLAPQAGTCDIVVSAMTITKERAANALFSDPYFDADQSLLIRKADAGSIKTLADMAGKVIGVQTGTTGEIYAQENAPADATLKSFDEPAAMFLALQSGDIDGILQDFPVNLDRANQDPNFVVTQKFFTGEQYGFATSKDRTALMDAINAELKKLKDNGGYDEVFQKYFPGA